MATTMAYSETNEGGVITSNLGKCLLRVTVSMNLWSVSLTLGIKLKPQTRKK